MVVATIAGQMIFGIIADQRVIAFAADGVLDDRHRRSRDARRDRIHHVGAVGGQRHHRAPAQLVSERLIG